MKAIAMVRPQGGGPKKVLREFDTATDICKIADQETCCEQPTALPPCSFCENAERSECVELTFSGTLSGGLQCDSSACQAAFNTTITLPAAEEDTPNLQCWYRLPDNGGLPSCNPAIPPNDVWPVEAALGGQFGQTPPQLSVNVDMGSQGILNWFFSLPLGPFDCVNVDQVLSYSGGSTQPLFCASDFSGITVRWRGIPCPPPAPAQSVGAMKTLATEMRRGKPVVRLGKRR